jgi:hypothetical protein
MPLLNVLVLACVIVLLENVPVLMVSKVEHAKGLHAQTIVMVKEDV